MFTKDIVRDITDPDFKTDGIVLFGERVRVLIGGASLVVVLHLELSRKSPGSLSSEKVKGTSPSLSIIWSILSRNVSLQASIGFSASA